MLYVWSSDKLKCTTADISLMLDINRKFSDRKDVGWRLSHEITGKVHETHAKSRVILYRYHDYSQFSDGQNTEFALFTLIKGTNLDIQDAACLHMVHTLQNPTSLPITVNTKYNGQCCGKDPFPSSGRQIWLIDKAVHPKTSSTGWREERVGDRKGPSPRSIA